VGRKTTTQSINLALRTVDHMHAVFALSPASTA